MVHGHKLLAQYQPFQCVTYKQETLKETRHAEAWTALLEYAHEQDELEVDEC